METKYIVESKGAGRLQWDIHTSVPDLKGARRLYNFYKSGFGKMRIRRVQIIKKEKIIAQKKA